MFQGNFQYGQREVSTGPNQQEQQDTSDEEIVHQCQENRRMSGLYRIPQQVPIYDADTMKPMFKSRNTPNRPPVPVKPMHPYHGEATQPPPLMSVNIPRTVRSASVSRCENDDSTPSRRSRHSSAQRTQKRKGKRPNSVDRRENTSIRGRQQFTDHAFAGNQSVEVSSDEFRENSQPFPIVRDERQHVTNIPSADEVFNFMVKNMDGKGTPGNIMTQSNLFPRGDFDINDWFRKNKSRFTLIERNGFISYVLVFDKNVTYCFNYCKMDSCSRSNCRRYHVCKNLLSGTCKLGRKGCKLSHDCLDENNIKLSNELGYSNFFMNEEIISILKASFPHVCTAWALRGACRERSCFGLHICPRYILGKCNNGPTCPHVHDRKSVQNKPILDAFEMSEMPYNLFKWRVFMINNPAWHQNEPKPVDCTASSHQATKPTAASSHKETKPTAASSHQETKHTAASSHQETKPTVNNKTVVSELADEAGDTFICIKYLLKKCRSRCCKFIHSKNRPPYIWQIKLFDTWISLKESEEIEKIYSENEYKSGKIRMTYDGIELVIQMLFEPKIRARVITDEGQTYIEARRLSTQSYKQTDDVPSSQEKKMKDNKGDFYTQWRWYFMDDPNHWQLFEPDSFQHTLEAKYLANQRTYTFSRYNFYFNYTISFDSMYQINDDTGKRRTIRRRPIFVTSEGKSFPECLSSDHLIMTPLPKFWVPWDLAQPFELVDISDTSSSELDTVTKLFFSTIDFEKEKIDTIYRLQNHKLWGLFCNQERTMDANDKRVKNTSSTSVDKRYLFHGTDNIDAVRGICMHNFDVRVSGKTGTLYGDGAYFARDAKYSHAYTKGPIRYVFVASVLIGHYTKGEKTYRRPPHKPGSNHELFDSCVDDMKDPSIFVVFDKNQYYPEFLIKYHDEKVEDATRKISSKVPSTAYKASGTSVPNYDRLNDVSQLQNIPDPSFNVDYSQSSRKLYSSSSDGLVSNMYDSAVGSSKTAKKDVTMSDTDFALHRLYNLKAKLLKRDDLRRSYEPETDSAGFDSGLYRNKVHYPPSPPPARRRRDRTED